MKNILLKRALGTLVCALLCIQCAIAAFAGRVVYPGGMPFGVKFSCDGLMIVGFSELKEAVGNPAYDAGLRLGDMILAVDDVPVRTAEDFASLLGERSHLCIPRTNKRTKRACGYATRLPGSVP